MKREPFINAENTRKASERMVENLTECYLIPFAVRGENDDEYGVGVA